MSIVCCSDAIQYKEIPWDGFWKPPYPHSFSALYGPGFSAMPAVTSTDPKWIPDPKKKVWKEECKPARCLRHVKQFHVDQPGRVMAAHVTAYEKWFEFEQDETQHVYDPFVWPVPKGCPAGDPTAAAPVARGTRPLGDFEREAASRARGEEVSHSVTNDGTPSQCRAAGASTARSCDRQEEARIALAEAEGNNPIEQGGHYIVCFELTETPDELFFTLMLATNVSVFRFVQLRGCLGAPAYRSA